MLRLKNNMISIIWSFMRLILYKLFCFNRFHFYPVERISPNVVIEVNRGGLLDLGKRVRIHSGCKIKVRSGGVFYIGNDVKVNYNCIFICRKKITIGEGTEFGPGVYIYDHDHDYKSGLKAGKFISDKVVIGKRCWIGANSVILKGAVIGDDSVVAAGAVVSGHYENGSLICAKREIQVRDIESHRKCEAGK